MLRISQNTEDAKLKLEKRFNFDDEQAQAIVDMQLKRLTHLLIEDLQNEIKEFVKNESSDKTKFDEIRRNLVEEQEKTLKKEERLNDSEKNQIWNFCLLDEHTNKSYGNSIFPVKRRIIMGKEMGKRYVLDDNLNETTVPNKVAFVPGCTKDALMPKRTDKKCMTV